MRHKSIRRLLVFFVMAPLLLSLLTVSGSRASETVNVTEGGEQDRMIKVLRVDEDGNEITESQGSGDEEEESGAPGESSARRSVSEEDKSSGTPAAYEEMIRGDSREESGVSEKAFGGNSGSASGGPGNEKPGFYIETAGDLEELAANCSLDTWSRGRTVILKNDIDVSGSDFRYIPIFAGVFDGRGHTVSGLHLTGEESYAGFFCIIQESALIKDLHVRGEVLLSGNQLAVGGIAGENYGIIRNCSFEGMVDGYDYSGGIVGYNEKPGVISGCESAGLVSGIHFTGGIAGYNQGLVSGCANNSQVNITSVDETLAKKDFDISEYANNLRDLFGSNNKHGSTSVLESTIDTGGICGYSRGNVVSCVNNKQVGYEHVGYNVGGIVGRQCGYVDMCINNGRVYGRKDVGGIVGQAEPQVNIDISDDIIEKLTTNMNSLHDLVNVTLNDAGDESDIVSRRLNVVKSFTDKALGDTSYLANETENWVNNLVNGGNEVLDRLQYAISETSKSGGMIDLTKNAASDLETTISRIKKTVNDLDIRRYMTEEEKEEYDRAVENIDSAMNEHRELVEKYNDSDYDYEYYRFINERKDRSSYSSSTSKLVPVDADGNVIDWPGTVSGNKADYDRIAKIVRLDTSSDPPVQTDFPSASGEFADADKGLDNEAGLAASAIVLARAEEEFRSKYGESYPLYLENNLNTVVSIISAHLNEMSEQSRKDVSGAINSARSSVTGLKDAVEELGSVLSGLSERGKVTLPGLSTEYRDRTNSLVANIQGMSDNLGLLNNELNSSNQKLIDDMARVNDQFNAIMLLIADAIDGVMDFDTTDIYMDDSLSVAETCTEGTVADSSNNGSVRGDINVSGIAGTMAIEYDFDLESDITGINDAARGVTYRSKCVSRNNRNDGTATGGKSYVGGVCGYQEMGTVLRCQNYGKVESLTGDYVGGITGKSLSIIRNCYSKGIMEGRSYVGGITGKGYDIAGCVALPTVKGEDEYLGAIAGDNDKDGEITDNRFVSDELAGVDRVSFSGKAEPVTYEELMAIPGIPREFGSIKVSFVFDDDILAVEHYDYGSSVERLPKDMTNVSDGEYIIWECEDEDFGPVRSDIELIGTAKRYRTTLAGSQLRQNGQSAVLVDGRFVEDQKLITSHIETESEKHEEWHLTIPSDGRPSHMVRYYPPEEAKDTKIWLKEGDRRIEAETVPVGKYLTFMTTGSEVVFIAENAVMDRKMIYAAIGGAAALLLLAVSLFILSRTRKKKSKLAAPKAEK